jgi:hypothetical protein
MPPLRPKSSNNDFLKFTGMAIQMAVTIGVFIFIGRKLDGEGGVLFTLIGSLIGVSASFYSTIKSLNKK